MRFKIPGKPYHIRFFEPVVTEDTQYTVADCGVEYGDGSIDSLVVGGSFATLRKLAKQADANEVEAKTVA